MPKIVDKEQMQAAIISAAETVFLREGVKQAKMIDIAKEMGVAKGTVYIYFPSKDALISAVVDRFFRAAQVQLDSTPCAASLPQFHEKLAQMLADASPKQSQLVRFFTLFGGALTQPEIRTPLAQFFETLADHLAKDLQQVCPHLPHPDATARTLVAVIDGLTLHRGLFGHNPDPETTKRLINALILPRPEP